MARTIAADSALAATVSLSAGPATAPRHGHETRRPDRRPPRFLAGVGTARAGVAGPHRGRPSPAARSAGPRLVSALPVGFASGQHLHLRHDLLEGAGKPSHQGWPRSASWQRPVRAPSGRTCSPVRLRGVVEGGRARIEVAGSQHGTRSPAPGPTWCQQRRPTNRRRGHRPSGGPIRVITACWRGCCAVGGRG